MNGRVGSPSSAVLLPALGEPTSSLSGLAARLRAAGWVSETIGRQPRRNLADHVADLHSAWERCSTPAPRLLVGASYGGMVAASFLGWFTAGNIAGEFLAEKLQLQNRSQPITTALGTAVITFTIGFLGAIPFMIGESVIWMVVMALGLGATALTKFGTRAYPLVAAPVVNQDKVTAVLDTLPDDANTK